MAPEVSPVVLPWEEFIDNECLIEEIQRRPPLYVKHAADSASAATKRKLWEEVCGLLFPATWDRLTAAHKTKTVRYVRQRWWNIRTSFSRDLKAQHSVMSGHAPQKRRKHPYFEKLLFLLPTLEPGVAASDPATAADDVLVISQQAPQKARPRPKAAVDQPQPLAKRKAAAAVEGELNFALSLVPMLQALSREERLAAQIEMLQVLQKFSCGHQ